MTARSLFKAILRAPGNALIDSASHFTQRVGRIVRRDVSISGRFLPYAPESDAWVIPPRAKHPPDAQLPLPPQDLWLRYGRTPEEYLAGGRRDVESMQRHLSRAGIDLSSCKRVLDLGCGSGRMIRWLDGVRAEVWGSDVSAPHIVWCQQNLSPPYRFLTNTSYPHLPFESGYFDVIYAGSLFTHISELVDAWLLEIRRLLRAGGAAYVTIHDEHTLRALERNPGRPLAQRLKNEPQARQFWRSPFGMFTLRRGFNALVVYDGSFIRDSWGSIMPIVSITPEAYDLQSAVLMAKEPGPGSRGGI